MPTRRLSTLLLISHVCGLRGSSDDCRKYPCWKLLRILSQLTGINSCIYRRLKHVVVDDAPKHDLQELRQKIECVKKMMTTMAL